jgi:hypothetical protein
MRSLLSILEDEDFRLVFVAARKIYGAAIIASYLIYMPAAKIKSGPPLTSLEQICTCFFIGGIKEGACNAVIHDKGKLPYATTI